MIVDINARLDRLELLHGRITKRNEKKECAMEACFDGRLKNEDEGDVEVDITKFEGPSFDNQVGKEENEILWKEEIKKINRMLEGNWEEHEELNGAEENKGQGGRYMEDFHFHEDAIVGRLGTPIEDIKMIMRLDEVDENFIIHTP